MSANPPLLTPAPWDVAALGMPAWEIRHYSPAALQLAQDTPGHHTIKVDPLTDKRALHDGGFYYTDTLLETVGTRARVRAPGNGVPAAVAARISHDFDLEQAVAICHGAFVHGRFHRDFLVDPAAADQRYDQWLRQLASSGQVYGLFAGDALAGFLACQDNALLLHAVAPAWRGRGLAKYWWHQVISALLDSGHDRVTSSISASNMAVLNLYASLGFSFDHPQDVYHRIVQ